MHYQNMMHLITETLEGSNHKHNRFHSEDVTTFLCERGTLSVQDLADVICSVSAIQSTIASYSGCQ